MRQLRALFVPVPPIVSIVSTKPPGEICNSRGELFLRFKREMLVCGLCSALCVGNVALAQPRSTKLTDLPPTARSSISSSLGRGISGYKAVRVAEGFRVADPQHRLTTDFTADSVTVRSGTATWRMKVTAYGRGSTLKPVPTAAPEADANRIQYRRGQLTEWYLNGPVGLEQGFTVGEPGGKARDGPLTVALSLTGNLTAVKAGHNALSLVGLDGGAKLRYSGLAAHDARGQHLQVWLELQADRLLLRVNDRSARYPVVIDPWVQAAEVTASDGGNTDQFGWSVGVSGNVVVVGAPFHTVGANAAQGAAYVFVESGNGWANMTESAELTASDGAVNAYFGSSVAISGNTIVVGAGGTTINGNPRQGAVYVFVEPVSGWRNMTETAELTASDGYVGDNLGDSVSISGNTVVAGAPYAGVGSNFEQGAAYVFVQPENGWSNMTQTAKLTASDGAANDILGVAVNVSDNTVVVGASEATVGGNTSAGAAYLFVEGASGWSDMTQTAKLTASDAAMDDYFGSSVDMSGNTVVVGAPSDFTGAVYVFVQPTKGWSDMTQTAELTPSALASKLLAGESVAISSNIVVAGAPAATVGDNANVGELLVFLEPRRGWVDMNETARLYSSNEASGDCFGHSVAMGNDAGVASAPFHINHTTGSQGSGYIFQTLNSRPSLSSLVPNNTDAGGPQFTLTVNGSNFVKGTVVNWSGSPRNTTYVSPTEVQATILASDIAQPGYFKVSATNPPPGGGNSRNQLTFTVNNPVPSILSLHPDNTLAGGSDFTLTVKGSNFVAKSKVLWNGTELKTTFVNTTKLTALVPARAIEAGGTFQITVSNPAPGGGTSQPANFTVNDPVPSLTALSPSQTKAGGPAFTLTVKGDNFVAASQVYWKGSPRHTTFGGPHTLKASILASDIKNPGTAKVTVGNPAPGGGLSNALTFTINP